MKARLHILGCCVLAISLCVCLGQQLWGRTAEFRPLSADAERDVVGGIFGWMYCANVGPACPKGVPLPPGLCPPGMGDGGICPGTSYCVDTLTNQACTPANYPQSCPTPWVAGCQHIYETCMAGTCRGMTNPQGTTVCGTVTVCE